MHAEGPGHKFHLNNDLPPEALEYENAIRFALDYVNGKVWPKNHYRVTVIKLEEFPVDTTQAGMFYAVVQAMYEALDIQRDRPYLKTDQGIEFVL